MISIIGLSRLRKSKGIGQSEIAEILGINQSQVSEIERGIRPMSSKYETILINQFGKDECDKFMVEANDDRRIAIRGSKNAIAQDTNGNVRQHSNNKANDDNEDNLQKRLEECLTELEKAKKDLEHANKRIDKLLSIIENLSKE